VLTRGVREEGMWTECGKGWMVMYGAAADVDSGCSVWVVKMLESGLRWAGSELEGAWAVRALAEDRQCKKSYSSFCRAHCLRF